jgi:hypothetical protein
MEKIQARMEAEGALKKALKAGLMQWAVAGDRCKAPIWENMEAQANKAVAAGCHLASIVNTIIDEVGLHTLLPLLQQSLIPGEKKELLGLFFNSAIKRIELKMPLSWEKLYPEEVHAFGELVKNLKLAFLQPAWEKEDERRKKLSEIRQFAELLQKRLQQHLLKPLSGATEKSQPAKLVALNDKEQAEIAAQVIAGAAPADVAKVADMKAADAHDALLVNAARSQLSMSNVSLLDDEHLIGYLGPPLASLSAEASNLAKVEAGRRAKKKLDVAIDVLEAGLRSGNCEEVFYRLMAYCGHLAHAQRLWSASGTPYPDAAGMIKPMLEKIEKKANVLALLCALSAAFDSHSEKLAQSGSCSEVVKNMADGALFLTGLLSSLLKKPSEAVNPTDMPLAGSVYGAPMNRIVSNYLYNNTTGVSGIACNPHPDVQDRDFADAFMAVYKEDEYTDNLYRRLITDDGLDLPVCRQLGIDLGRNADIDVNGIPFDDFIESEEPERVQKFVRTLRDQKASDPQIMAASRIACATANNLLELMRSKKLFTVTTDELKTHGADLSNAGRGMVPSGCKQKTRISCDNDGSMTARVFVHASALSQCEMDGNIVHTDPDTSAFRAEIVFLIDQDGGISIKGNIVAGLEREVTVFSVCI